MALATIQTITGKTTTTTTTSGSTRTTTTSTPVTTITSSTERFDNGVIDVSIIPYMRHQLIQFTAEGLRPNRRIYFFFDDTDVTDNIINGTELLLNENASNVIVNSGFSNTDTITGNTNSAKAQVVQASRFYDFVNATPSLQDNGSARERRRILRLANVSGTFANSEGFVTNISSNAGSIGAIRVNGSETLQNFFQDTSANTVTLPAHAGVVANNYWGTNGANTIILMTNVRNGGRAVRAYIRGYDNVSRTLYLANTLSDIITANPTVSIPTSNTDTGATRISWTIANTTNNTFYTDFEGKVTGTFSVPAGQFRTGERIFRVIDTPDNDPDNATTRAEYRFVSSGLSQTKNDVVINSVDVKTEVVQTVRTEQIQTSSNKSDPIAQTFFVNGNDYPNGIFLSGVGVYFYNKDQILPVKIEIRPTVNGYPSSSDILPNSTVILDADKITTSTDGSIETKFKFNHPVYLSPGEWALVIRSDSLEYEVFSAELGAKIIGTNRTVSEQPYVGSFFKSQNGSTWDAIQLEDLTFNLYKCVFSTSGTVQFYNNAPLSNANADVLFAHLEDSKLPNTSIRYTHSYDGGLSYSNYDIDSDVVPATRIPFYNQSSNVGKYRLTATISTNDTSVSPILYSGTSKLIAVENYVDNADLDVNNITITNTGSGYDANANIALTFTGLAGSGALAYARANSTGYINQIIMATGGEGYTQNVNVLAANGISVAANGGIFVANGNGATITVSSELDASGGPALAKYISRVVTLATGFEATDLRVFLTAYKPLNTDIKVYYKVKSSNDPDQFADKGYQLMSQVTSSGLYSSQEGFRDSAIEYEFRPAGSNAITYTSGSSTYKSFTQFAFKIVLLSSDTTKVPVVYDMRAVALP